MEKTFRDILAEFLEGNEPKFTPSPNEATQSPDAPHYEFEPLWRPDFEQNPSRKGMNRYKPQRENATSRGSGSGTTQPKAPPPPPRETPPETVFPLETLHPADLARVKQLVALGATNLTQGLTEGRLKKAYRILARKFHPDRMTGASPEKIAAASAQFVLLQTAYNDLMDSIKSEWSRAA